MSLPENLYYPIAKIAKELNCDVSDIIHLAANGLAKVCIKVYSPGEGFRSDSKEWSPSLLVNYEAVNGVVTKSDVTYKDDEFGGDLACYSQEFNYINSYLKLSGRVDFWLESESLQVVDSTTVAYGVFGLIEISERDLYVNEMRLIGKDSILVSTFRLPEDVSNETVMGYFRLPGDLIYIEDLIIKDDDNLRENGVENFLSHESGFSISVDDLLITKDEYYRLSGKLNGKEKNTINNDISENPKSLAKKAEVIPAIISLLPDFKSIDIDMMPVSKIKNIVETIAAKQGIELPNIHIQTWQKYLGRNKPRK